MIYEISGDQIEVILSNSTANRDKRMDMSVGLVRNMDRFVNALLAEPTIFGPNVTRLLKSIAPPDGKTLPAGISVSIPFQHAVLAVIDFQKVRKPHDKLDLRIERRAGLLTYYASPRESQTADKETLRKLLCYPR